MTVNTELSKRIYTGNGIATDYDYNFKIPLAGDLAVSLFDLDGVELPQVLNTDYTVTGAGGDNGGKVLFTAPPPSGYTILLLSDAAYTQPTDFKNQGRFFPETHENAIDRAVILSRQNHEAITRSITLPPQVEGVSTQLPVPQVSTLFGWNGDGSAIENFPLSTIATQIAYGDKNYQVFTGTGAQVNFTLSQNPGSLGNLEVSIDGVVKVPVADYTYSGTTLTFTSPPGNGTVVFVRFDTAVPVGTGLASAINFQQLGAASVVRPSDDKMRERVTPQDYGAVADGVSDDTTAINRAVAYAISVGKLSINMPAGRYRITSKIDIALPGFKGFSFEGEGMGITEILVDYAAGNGFEITASTGNYWLDVDQHAAIRLANFTLVTNRVDVGTGILVNGGSLAGRPPQACVFDHVEFRGATSFFHAFSLCVDLLDAASVQFIGCRWICGGPGVNTADGVRVRASGSGKDPTEVKFTDCEWYFCDIAVNAGDYVEGLYFNNPSMVNCNKGIRYVTTTGESGMAVNGGHFNNYSRNIEIENVFDISITGPVMFHADTSAGFRHISLKNCGAFTIQGHTIRGASTDAGIFVESVPAGWGGTIGTGYFRGVSAGVYLDSGSRNVTVAPQSYDSVTDRVVDAGTANKVQPTVYTYTAVIALAGGSPTEAFNIAIPSGMFGADALDAQCQINGAFNLGVHYDRDSGSNTPTNARFVAVPNAGGNVSGGNYRITATIIGV